MNHYLVITPAYDTYSSYDGYSESGCDTCQVHAETEEDAKVLSLKFPDMKGWVRLCKFGKENPLSGLKVENMRCGHGFCWCDECTKGSKLEYCEQCDKEADEIPVDSR